MHVRLSQILVHGSSAQSIEVLRSKKYAQRVLRLELCLA